MGAQLERMLDARDEAEKTRPELLEELERRCAAAKIPYAARPVPGAKTAAEISFRAGRDRRTFVFSDIYHLQALIESQFEKCVLLGDYLAVCSYQQGTIEAAARPLHPLPTVRRHPLGIDSTERYEWPLRVDSTDGISLVMAFPSALLGTLHDSNQRGVSSISVQIQGARLKNHDHALRILESLTGAFFLQIEMLFGTQLALVKCSLPAPTKLTRSTADPLKQLAFPKVTYDREPLSLYSYARSAIGMPLLQFLAYYQVIEFYFSTYSQVEARKRIRVILNSPTFRSDRDADIGRILATIRASGTRVGDERSQLRATVSECVDPNRLREFLCRTEEHKKFFADQGGKIAKRYLPLNSPGVVNLDLRNDVADRVYEIRCKIVHTKSGSVDADPEVDPLLPFSREVEALTFDIELVQFIAQQVIVAAGNPITVEPLSSGDPDAESPG